MPSKIVNALVSFFLVYYILKFYSNILNIIVRTNIMPKIFIKKLKSKSLILIDITITIFKIP